MARLLTQPMTRHIRRLAIAVVVFVVTGVMPVATAQPAGLSAGEGEWAGFVSFTGAGPSGVARSFRGGFEFASTGGELDGSFGWSAEDVSMQGVVTGPSTMPQFILTAGVSRGVAIPDVSGGGEIEFTASTCERLEGIGVNWDPVFAAAATITDVVWWAVRDGSASDPGVFLEAVNELRTEIDDIVDGLALGRAVARIIDRVEPLIGEAERLASTLNRTDGCGLAFYRSVIANEVARLVDYILTHPEVGDLLFSQVMLMAVRVGLMGSGAESGGASYEDRAREATAARIAAAIATRNPTALDFLAGLSAEFGWDDLEREAILGIVEVGY